MKTDLFLFLLQTIYSLASCVQIPKAIGAFYHVWKWHNVQRARSDMQRCTTMLSTDPSHDNRTITITLKMQIWIATNNRNVLRVIKTKFPATVTVFGVVSSEGHIMPPHIFEIGMKVNTKVYLNVLKSVLIPWCNQVASEGVLRLCPFATDLNPPDISFGHTSRTSPTCPSHCTKTSLIAATRRAPAGSCEESVLPVPCPYRGGDWG